MSWRTCISTKFCRATDPADTGGEFKDHSISGFNNESLAPELPGILKHPETSDLVFPRRGVDTDLFSFPQDFKVKLRIVNQLQA